MNGDDSDNEDDRERRVKEEKEERMIASLRKREEEVNQKFSKHRCFLVFVYT